MPMREYTYYVVGRQKVEILQRFDNSVLVRYVKSGTEACIRADFVKKKTVKYQPKKNTNGGKPPQTKLDL